MTCIRKSTTWSGKTLLVATLALAANCAAGGQCASTPGEAVESSLGRAAQGGLPARDRASGAGYRVWRTQDDPALRRQWVWVEACDGAGPALLAWVPWVPMTAGEPVPESRAAVEASLPMRAPSRFSSYLPGHLPARSLVRPGDAVELLQAGDDLSMNLSGRAMEAGGLGDKIRVQITAALAHGAVVEGTVSGKDVVDLGDIDSGSESGSGPVGGGLVVTTEGEP